MEASNRIHVFYDGSCSFCRKTLRHLRALDWFKRLHFVNFQNENERREFAPDIPYGNLNRSMHARFSDGTVLSGFSAFRRICWSLPLLWIPAPFLYIPGVKPVGDAVYDKIAARRNACTHERCDLKQ